MIIKKYNTEIENFYIFVSHKKEGLANVTYGLVLDDKTMVEIIPGYGPITTLRSDRNIIDYYINNNCDRSDWTQRVYDDYNINLLLSESRFLEIVEILRRYF